MNEWLLAISSFLGGAFLTMVGFVVANVREQTTVKNDVKAIKDKLLSWEEHGMPTCSFHQGMVDKVQGLEVNVASKLGNPFHSKGD